MIEYALPNAAAHKITVTSTATTVLALINTAASATVAFPGSLNLLEISPEDYSIRFTTDGTTPTASNGILVRVGDFRVIKAPFKQIQVIRAEGTNAVCSVRVGTSDDDSESSVGSANVTLNTGDIEIGAVELKDAGTDTRANILAANTARTTATVVVATQQVAADGTVPPSGSLVSNAPFSKLTDGTDTLDVFVDDSAYTPGTSTGLVIMGQADETSTDEVNEGDAGAVRISLRRAMMTSMDTALAGEDLTNGVIAVAQKPMAATTYTTSRDTSAALEASSISKASAGNLYHAFGVVSSTAPTDIYYIQFLNSATLTGDGAVTHLITPIPVNHVSGTDSSFEAGPFPFGVAASAGIVIVISTTMVTKTISGSYLFATVLYV